MIGCYWAHLTLWLGGSKMAQLIMGISGHLVTCVLVKFPITGLSCTRGADFQEVCCPFLQLSWPCSRTPGACVGVLPWRFAINYTFHLFPPLTPFNNWTYDRKLQGCLHFNLELLQSSFMLSAQVKAGWILCHLECGLEQFSQVWNMWPLESKEIYKEG